MHNRFSLVSRKQHLQWKSSSVLSAPSTLPSPADPQDFPGWIWRAGQHPNFSETAPAEDLGESQQTGTGLPYASIPLPALEQLCLACLCLRVACGSLCSCATDTEPPCPQGWLSAAFLLTLHALNQLRGPGGDRVSPSALLKSFSTKNSWLNKCSCFSQTMLSVLC